MIRDLGRTMIIESTLLRWILLLPILGMLACTAFSVVNRRDLARIFGPGVILGAFVLSLFTVGQLWTLRAGGSVVDHLYTWIAASPLTIEATLRVDALTSVLLLVITGVGFLIHVYSIGYMHDDADEARFFAYLNLFVASMLVLVLGDSLPLLFVGWEGVGLCSYLLIGFWWTDTANADAGRKAFVANRIGDAAFLIGMFLLFWHMNQLGTPSLAFGDVNRLAPKLGEATPGIVTAVCLLFLVGATGKSAQIPLYTWLPDAMAGPTPVSALIHAATMVTAGVYLICRLSPLYAQAPLALEVVAVVGAVTALFAASIAIVQRDLKKILAYSTISQLGYMFLAVGCGAFSIGVFHLMTHAFFKACLFLCAGSVMHALHGELDVWKMGGLRKRMPVTAITFLLAALSISGVPGFAGFFSKDMILESAFVGHHYVLWLIDTVAAGLTAFYVFRAFFLTFMGPSRLTPELEHHAHESPRSMTMPMIVLAVLAVVGGYGGLPGGFLWGDRFSNYLAPVLADVAHPEVSTGTLLGLMGLASIVAVTGIGTAWYMYVREPGLPELMQTRARAAYDLLYNKYWVDEIYDALIVRPYVRLSTVFWSVVDARLIDGAVNGTADLVGRASASWRRVQSGNLQHYAYYMVVGALGVLVALLVR
jgi:NADH-quinone oxidoreductase subunit L